MSNTYNALIPIRLENISVDGSDCLDVRYRILPVGRSSAGWAFLLYTHPDLGIDSLEDWERILDQYPWTLIQDSYNTILPKESLRGMATTRVGNPEGFLYDSEFLRKNLSYFEPETRLLRFNPSLDEHVVSTDTPWDILPCFTEGGLP